MKRLCSTALCAAALFLATPLGASAGAASIGDKIQSKQAEVEATHKRLEQKRGQLRFQEVRAQDMQRQLSETNRGITDVTASLQTLSDQVRSNQRRLAWNKRQLDAAQQTLERHNDALRRRLVDAYERGDLSYVNVLLSATSFSDFVERWDDIRYLIATNEKTVRERKAAEDKVADAQRGLQSQQAALDRAIHLRQQAKFQLAALAEQRQGLLAAADAERRSVAGEVAVLEELSAAQEAALEDLIRDRQRIEAERRAAEAAARRRAALLAGQEVVPLETPLGAPSSFSWPVSGPITSPFGMRADPLGRGFHMHEGIDIAAPTGTTIAAAAGGRVIFAGWYGGYGNAIVIDHGGHTSTLYGHCSQIFVAEGQDVQRGQPIGAVGSTGNSTGPHVHFEVRVNGVPVDPTARLR
ncbi:MAG: peptidoglycan DD-metalloendopeptidase family protein [Candidatus Baltobacteraceae bacterium]